MAFLNKQEREQLANELRGMNFNRAKGKVRGMDAKARLRYFRNSMSPDHLHTRYELVGLGTVVTLIEKLTETEKSPGSALLKSKYEVVDVIVEPTADNRT